MSSDEENYHKEFARVFDSYLNLIETLISNMISSSNDYYEYLINNDKLDDTKPVTTSAYPLIISDITRSNITPDSVNFYCNITSINNLMKTKVELIIDECIYKKIIKLLKETPDNYFCYIALVDKFVLVWYGPIKFKNNAQSENQIKLYILMSENNTCHTYPSELFIKD